MRAISNGIRGRERERNVRKTRAIGNGAFRTVTLCFAGGVESEAVREREREVVGADIV